MQLSNGLARARRGDAMLSAARSLRGGREYIWEVRVKVGERGSGRMFKEI